MKLAWPWAKKPKALKLAASIRLEDIQADPYQGLAPGSICLVTYSKVASGHPWLRFYLGLQDGHPVMVYPLLAPPPYANSEITLQTLAQRDKSVQSWLEAADTAEVLEKDWGNVYTEEDDFLVVRVLRHGWEGEASAAEATYKAEDLGQVQDYPPGSIVKTKRLMDPTYLLVLEPPGKNNIFIASDYVPDIFKDQGFDNMRDLMLAHTSMETFMAPILNWRSILDAGAWKTGYYAALQVDEVYRVGWAGETTPEAAYKADVKMPPIPEDLFDEPWDVVGYYTSPHVPHQWQVRRVNLASSEILKKNWQTSVGLHGLPYTSTDFLHCDPMPPDPSVETLKEMMTADGWIVVDLPRPDPTAEATYKASNDDRSLPFQWADADGFRGQTTPPDHGLLFAWNGGMVMDRVGVNLDTAFIDKDGRITDIQTMIAEPEAETPSKTYRGSNGAYRYVLEAREGYFAEAGWTVGDRLVWANGQVKKVPMTTFPKVSAGRREWPFYGVAVRLSDILEADDPTGGQSLFDQIMENLDGFFNDEDWVGLNVWLHETAPSFPYEVVDGFYREETNNEILVLEPWSSDVSDATYKAEAQTRSFAEIAPLAVLEYAFGPMAARWGEEAVRKAVSTPVRVFSAPDWAEALNRPHTPDDADVLDNRFHEGFPAHFDPQRGVFHVADAAQEDGPVMLRALAQAVHRYVFGKGWCPPTPMDEFAAKLKEHGFNSLSARQSVLEALAVGHTLRVDGLLALLETVRYMVFTGVIPDDRRAWLRRHLPERVPQFSPAVEAFLLEEHDKDPKTLAEMGWPLPVEKMLQKTSAVELPDPPQDIYTFGPPTVLFYWGSSANQAWYAVYRTGQGNFPWKYYRWDFVRDYPDGWVRSGRQKAPETMTGRSVGKTLESLRHYMEDVSGWTLHSYPNQEQAPEDATYKADADIPTPPERVFTFGDPSILVYRRRNVDENMVWVAYYAVPPDPRNSERWRFQYFKCNDRGDAAFLEDAAPVHSSYTNLEDIRTMLLENTFTEYPLENRDPSASTYKADALYSVVSIPRDGLDPSLWDTAQDPPALKPEVRDIIIGRLMGGLRDRGFTAPEEWVARVLLIGGSTGNQWEDDSDIDVTIVIDFDAFREHEGDSVDEETTQTAVETTVASTPKDAYQSLVDFYLKVVAPGGTRIAANRLSALAKDMAALTGMPWIADERVLFQKLRIAEQKLAQSVASGETSILMYPHLYKLYVGGAAAQLGAPSAATYKVSELVGAWLTENLKTASRTFDDNAAWTGNVYPSEETTC